MEIKQEEEEEEVKFNQHQKVEQKQGISNKFGDGVAWFRGPMIGKGSYGSVYLATAKKPKSKFRCFPRVIAVKSAEVSISGSIQKEKEALSNVGGCCNVIGCFGEETTIGEKGVMVYNLLLEYGSGGTLSDLIKKFGVKGLPESDVKRYTRGMLKGIHHIHESGYVHCDLKPENILLVPKSSGSSEFRVKIGDLGLAKRAKESKKRRLNPYYWRGTPMYLSPESVEESLQGCPSDIWALGCIVLEMLTGKPPWGGKEDFNADELLVRIGKGRALPEIPKGISSEARSFLKGCFVRKPMYRLTADMLLSHPFLDGLIDDVEEEDEECEEVSDADDELSCSSLSDDYSIISEDECSSSYYSGEEDRDGEMVSGVAEEDTLDGQQSGDNARSRINSEFHHVIKTSIPAPSNARQQYQVAFTIPAGV